MKSIPAFPSDKSALSEVLSNAREINPLVSGLTRISATHAICQVTGDTTPILVPVTNDQARKLGWMA